MPNDDQSIFLVASPGDARHVTLLGEKEIEFTEDMSVSGIKSVIFDPEQSQYIILCNKYNEKLGFFVLKMNELYP